METPIEVKLSREQLLALAWCCDARTGKPWARVNPAPTDPAVQSARDTLAEALEARKAEARDTADTADTVDVEPVIDAPAGAIEVGAGEVAPDELAALVD